MESYCLSIHSTEDFDLIEDEELREEYQDNFYDEIENVYQYLKANKINCMSWQQIDDTRFSIDLDVKRKVWADEIINGYMGDIDTMLEKYDIAFATIENYKYS